MAAAFIVSAVRTAIATSRKGSLAKVPGEVLAATVLKEAVKRSGLSPEMVDDVIFAESLAGGGAIARHAAVEVGLTRAGGMALNRHCAGSLTSVGIAAGSIVSGMERVVVAGGVQSASTMPRMQYTVPDSGEVLDWWIPATHPDDPEAPYKDMSITVGWNTAKKAELSREDMDAWAARSHARAVAAIDSGQFADEIVPVHALMPDGSTTTFMVDEHPRRDSTMAKLAALKVIHPEIEGFSITPGNSSGVNDAAAALVLTDADMVRAEGLNVQARVRGWTSIGIDPRFTGMAAIDVINKILSRTGVKSSDIALWEINEAFASVPVAACKILELDEETVNISGSGCSLGHPIAASGGRMLTTLINDLRRRGGGLGIAAMCAGGGQAGAVLIEV